MAMPEIHQHCKSSGQSDPDQAPDERFFEFDGVSAAVKYAQIERQHDRNKDIKEYPEGELIQGSGDFS